MCDAGDDYATTLVSTWRTANKQHRCCACMEPIASGSKYHFETSVYDGEVMSIKHCSRCWAMCKALWRRSPDAIDLRLQCGELWEDPPEDVAALAFALPHELAEQLIEAERVAADQMRRRCEEIAQGGEAP